MIVKRKILVIEDDLSILMGLQDNLEEAGKEDNLQVKFAGNKMHDKAVLIDEEWLSVGSQNFHYSAYGPRKGLSEYSLGTNEVQAIEDYQRLFEYQWEESVQP